MKVIDFHTHVVPGRYPERPQSCEEPNWPVMEKIDDRRSRMMIAGRVFREFESFYWNPRERLARLDEQGIAVQVISPLPELLSYWLAVDAAEALTDFMSTFVAEMVESAPTRFAGMGCVALQDPVRAVRQLEHMRKSLGLRGVHVGSHVNGTSLADPRFYPVFEAAEALEMFVFVHGIKPGGAALMLGPPLMPAVVGVPHETAMTISSFIMTDILGRFPRLKLVFSHGGGTIGAVIDRFNAVWKEFEPMRVVSTPPAEYAKRFYYDTVVFGADWLACLVRKFGASQLLAGTDGPVDFGQPRIADLLEETGLDAPDRERIAHLNAELLLGMYSA
jgi:aminocarboxymuconate-semialdehyde decarboxylase